MIVLLSGWVGFRSSLLALEWRLGRRLGRPVVRARVGLGIGCIRRSAEIAAEQIAALAAREGQRIDVIGHSMGGLVAAYALKRIDEGKHIRTVITLGTPHRGAPAVHIGHSTAARMSVSLAQMAPQSEFVRTLAAAPVPLGCRLISIAAHHDGVVPLLYSQLPRHLRQFNHRIEGCSHLGLLFSSDVLDLLERLLRVQNVEPAKAVATQPELVRRRSRAEGERSEREPRLRVVRKPIADVSTTRPPRRSGRSG